MERARGWEGEGVRVRENRVSNGNSNIMQNYYGSACLLLCAKGAGESALVLLLWQCVCVRVQCLYMYIGYLQLGMLLTLLGSAAGVVEG